ncbi:zinc finger, C2H2 type [Ostertagia ostertagi]
MSEAKVTPEESQEKANSGENEEKKVKFNIIKHISTAILNGDNFANILVPGSVITVPILVVELFYYLKAMCEEISYDEIYMPGEFERDTDGASSRRQATSVTENVKKEEGGDSSAAVDAAKSKPSASHPPNEIVEDVMRHVETDPHADRAVSADAAQPENVLEVRARQVEELIDGLCFTPEDECPYSCKKCHRGFYTIKELAEHEIRAHDMNEDILMRFPSLN